ncbi:MAG: phosphoglycerate dehydrogenase, partial [bacterium]
MKILVTPRSFASISKEPIEILKDKGFELLINDTGENYSEAQMQKLIKDVDGVIIGTDPLNENVLKEANKLKMISKYGVGTDNIDLDYAKKNNIVVANTPAANSRSVAELVITYIFAISRRIIEADKKTKERYQGKIVGNTVNGKTIGIFGLGKIGKSVARMAGGLSMNVLAFDINKDNQFAEEYNLDYVDFAKLITESDFISCHLPLNSNTENMISSVEFDKMKSNAILINTARSGVVNEEYLIDALLNDKIRGAALDVFDEEIITEI